jgi:hypothetical protein
MLRSILVRMRPIAAAARVITDCTTLGRSGLRVSPFCLRTIDFGDDMTC